jgi:hypothetical protein
MPTYERVCYCGGPVLVRDYPLDKKPKTLSYEHRRRVYFLRVLNGLEKEKERREKN